MYNKALPSPLTDRLITKILYFVQTVFSQKEFDSASMQGVFRKAGKSLCNFYTCFFKGRHYL